MGTKDSRGPRCPLDPDLVMAPFPCCAPLSPTTSTWRSGAVGNISRPGSPLQPTVLPPAPHASCVGVMNARSRTARVLWLPCPLLLLCPGAQPGSALTARQRTDSTQPARAQVCPGTAMLGPHMPAPAAAEAHMRHLRQEPRRERHHPNKPQPLCPGHGCRQHYGTVSWTGPRPGTPRSPGGAVGRIILG